jgi:hypothetical protein
MARLESPSNAAAVRLVSVRKSIVFPFVRTDGSDFAGALVFFL